LELDLKRLHRGSLDIALARAAHYRDLNQPEEAESICRDVLDVDADRQDAWKILGLALTDRLPSGQAGLLEEAIAAFEKLRDEYERTYHVGVAWERAAKAHLLRNEAHSAVAGFEHALQSLREAASRPSRASRCDARVTRKGRPPRRLTVRPAPSIAPAGPPPLGGAADAAARHAPTAQTQPGCPYRCKWPATAPWKSCV
jgi:tetratricopeptide (TPR) repeat protein